MRNIFSSHTQMFIVAIFRILHLSLDFHKRNFTYFVLVQVIARDLLITLVAFAKTYFLRNLRINTKLNANEICCAFSSTNLLHQYAICTIPQNKFPDNAKFAEFRKNQNLRLETLIRLRYYFHFFSNSDVYHLIIL